MISSHHTQNADAVADAIAQFQAQGVDLSNIITKPVTAASGESIRTCRDVNVKGSIIDV